MDICTEHSETIMHDPLTLSLADPYWFITSQDGHFRLLVLQATDICGLKNTACTVSEIHFDI
jgi:hypothetical protein